MTVQELIDELMKIEDKARPVCVLGMNGGYVDEFLIDSSYDYSYIYLEPK